MEPEYIRARQHTTTYDRFMHNECYVPLKEGKGIWPEIMANNYLRDKTCNKCGVKLQCSCSPYKVSEPKTGNCPHAKQQEEASKQD